MLPARSAATVVRQNVFTSIKEPTITAYKNRGDGGVSQSIAKVVGGFYEGTAEYELVLSRILELLWICFQIRERARNGRPRSEGSVFLESRTDGKPYD